MGIVLLRGCGDTTDLPSQRQDADPSPIKVAAKRFTFPDGPPPQRLIIKDLRIGSGQRLEKGDSFDLNYINFAYGTKRVLEKYWGKTAFHWGYGRNELVDGIELGLDGLRVGGRRELVVPSKLAYGTGPRVYLLELLKVEPPEAPGTGR